MEPVKETPVSGVSLQYDKGNLVVSVKVAGQWKTAIQVNWAELQDNPEHIIKCGAERFTQLSNNSTIDVRPGY